MPSRAKNNRRRQAQIGKGIGMPVQTAKSEAENISTFLKNLQSLPSRGDDDGADQELPGRPTKRAKTAGTRDTICIARGNMTFTASKTTDSECTTLVRSNIGEAFALQLRDADFEDPAQSKSQLHISPRTKSRGAGFRAVFCSHENLSPVLKTVFKVAETQGFDPGDKGCLWAAVDCSIRVDDDVVCLDLSVEVRWNETVTLWGSDRAKSSPQKLLRNEVLRTWYPELYIHDSTKGAQPSWSPQDFYEAACVPDKEAMDPEVSSMEIPQLQTTLYPFQRRAVQWLLRREGVHWRDNDQDKKGGVQPYNSEALGELPISFYQAKDADAKIFHLSPLLGVAVRDTALFRSFQEFRGGILAEEMGLGKTLEVIALVLLHRRPESPIMVFDPFLGRELLTTSATLIVAPSSLLDQWLSELNRHAPSLKVVYYPGIRKLAKRMDGEELSAENLAQQDVVITTYEVLRTEIWAAEDEPGRSMRNERQYERTKSPLVQLSWWRVCIDEAQMVENWTNNAAKLARRIPRINAWGVTGTPVKDDIQKGNDT
jgi:E3 ubiquitin-protein ligase SHPRH